MKYFQQTWELHLKIEVNDLCRNLSAKNSEKKCNSALVSS
jgi:hypothetical protein